MAATSDATATPGAAAEKSAPGPRRLASRTQRKVFDFTVTIDNPIHFCTDRDAHLMSALQNLLVGRNYKGARVVRILEVLASSAVHIQRTNGSGGGYVDVQVLAEVAVFSRWDILVGVAVVSNQPMVVGAYAPPGSGDPPWAAVPLAASRAAEALAVGQLFAARAIKAEHPPMQQQATVYATLLTCDQAAPVYRLRGVLDRSAKIELAPLLDDIEAELAARSALLATRRPDVWFFECLLHHYRARPVGADQTVAAWPGGPSWEGPPLPVPVDGGAAFISAVEIARQVVRDGASVPVAGIWSRPLSLYRSSPLVATVAGEGRAAPALPKGWAPPVDGVPRAVFAEFLKNILDHLVATRELPEVFHGELVERHASLWGAMRSAQKEPALGP